MFSFRNLAVAGMACIPVLGLVFGIFIGLAWLRAFMALGKWRVFPVALFVATIYFVLNVAVLAPALADYMPAKWLVAFLFSAWGIALVGRQIDLLESEAASREL